MGCILSAIRDETSSPSLGAQFVEEEAHMLRFGLIVALAVSVLLPAVPAAAQAACSFRGGFAQLQTLIPDRVGTCTADEQYRPDQGLSTQQTSTGTLIWHSVDNSLSFSDGFHAWVLDPNGKIKVR